MNIHGLSLPFRIVGILVLLTALVPLGFFAWTYSRTSSFLKHAVRTTGTVTAVGPSSAHSDTFAPTFTFNDGDGKAQTIHSTVSSNPPAYSVGDRVTIVYDPANPKDACADSFWELWLGPLISGILSIPPILIGLFFLWFLPWIIHRVFPPPKAPAGPC